MKMRNTALDHFMDWIPDEKLSGYRVAQHGAKMIGTTDLAILKGLIPGIMKAAAAMRATNPKLAVQIDLLVRAFQAALLHSFKYAGPVSEWTQGGGLLDGAAVIDRLILRHSEWFEMFQDCFTQSSPPSVYSLNGRTPFETSAVA
ncbi:MAG: hypothetical protein EBS01_07340 [Verrucomicrobia bacterium]|nr:hypothetical protein [Verrucomicrobiota bacterium]